MKAFVVVLSLAGCLVIAGCEFSCSVGGSVPAGELEKQVRLSYEDQTGILVKSISCEEAGDDTGSPISCKATNVNGVLLDIGGEVTSYDADRERVKFDWEVTRAVAPGTLYADAAARTLSARSGVPITEVVCPKKVVVEKGARIDCTAIFPDGSKSGVTLTLTDRDGGFRAEITGAASPNA